MEYINDKLKSIYNEMYQSLDETPIDKFEKIKDYCMEVPDRWDLSEDEDGDMFESYENELFDYLKSKYDDFE
jgi:hypothetical protein|tara:strand:- start:660 stop:875 length:216 start_codon:yes stop_codon:yes gene_type:complete